MRWFNIRGWSDVTIATPYLWLVIFFLPIAVALAVIFVLPPYLIWRVWRKQQANKKQAAVVDKAQQE